MTWRPFGSRRTQQTRCSAPPLPTFLAMAAAVLSWQTSNAWSAGLPQSANQVSSSAPSANLPTVTIEAKQELERRVNHFVTSEVFQAPGESITRWNKPICPSVIGLPRMLADYIQAHILDIARAANAPVGRNQCKIDLYVIATYDPEQMLKKLWAQVPHGHISRNGLPGIERVLDSSRPVRVWFNSELHCRINSMDGGKSADLQIRSMAGGTQIDTTSSYYCGGGGSRLSYSSVNAIRSALVVVDLNRMTQVSTRELADYVAMTGLADIRPDVDAGTAPTILRLFEDAQPSPHGLTAWDQALLFSIYNTSQSSVQQMSEMESTVIARIENRSDPGDTPAHSSSLSSPLWADEVIPQRDTNVISWYRAAAEHGDADAQYVLGVMYFSGQGVAQKDYGKAAQWLSKAADQGSAAAQYDLGLMYARGQGLSQNYATAAKWYSLGAEQGDSNAQRSLGLAYANGQGVPRSFAKAAQWFRTAAEKGDADAQFDLGVMYAGGGGVPRDYVEACKWWILAGSDSGSNDDAYALSLEKLKASASQVTAEQMARAHREASEWLSAHRPAK